MKFNPLPDIMTKTGITYEVARDGTTRSISKNGTTKVLKPQGNRLSIAGKMRNMSDIIKDAGWLAVDETTESNIHEELFESIRKGYQYEILISNYGRLKYIFRDGCVVIKSAEEMFNEHQKHVDGYPRITANGRHVKINDMVFAMFVGEIPDGFEICNIDGVKTNARLGNLHLVENTKSRENVDMFIASFVDKKLEKIYISKEAAVEHVINEYSNATIEELETSLQCMVDEDIPSDIYGRTWILVS
jgi:hypothetical protein